MESTSEVLKKFLSRLFFQNKDFCSVMNIKTHRLGAEHVKIFGESESLLLY